MRYTYIKWWQQLGIWLGLFFLSFSMYHYFHSIVFSIIAASFFTISLYLWHLIDIRFLLPRQKNENKHFILFVIISIIVYTAIMGIIDINFIDKYRVVKHERPPLIFVFIARSIHIVFLFFVDYTFNLMQQTVILKEKQKLLNEEKLETELKLLKAQINPHFIFNALNNIYSLSYMQSSKAPESILKLSEMLRYVFYDCSQDKVNISKEIKYVENFSSFQQMKSEHKQNISLNAELQNSLTEIAPMLLIPFIENAFKYSRIEEEKDAFVKIDILQNQKELNFCIKNSIPINNLPLAGSGTGIKNVRHRLNIIYPRRHHLDIKNINNEYAVELKIIL